MDSTSLLYKEAAQPPRTYTPVQSLKKVMARANAGRSQSLQTATSVRKEARQTAAKSGPATYPNAFRAAFKLPGYGGQHSRQSPQARPAPAPAVSQSQLPPDGFPPSTSGQEEVQRQHMLLSWYHCSWSLQTQSNTATATSSTHQLPPRIVPF